MGEVKRYEMDLAGRPIVAEIGRVAGQANGSALVHYGDTVVLVTACASDEPREGVNFFPLTVDYEERLYAVGRIPGGFIKREGRPSERAILAARLTDRPLRPLFPKGFRNDVQVIATVLSVDQDCSPEITGMLGASLSLVISDIPFEGPVGAVSVGYVDGELVINPTAVQNERSELDLIVAGTKDAILMVEAGAKEVSEETLLDAIELAHEHIKQLVDFQEKIAAEVGKEKREFSVQAVSEEILEKVRNQVWDKLDELLQNDDKQDREESLKVLEEQVLAGLAEEYPEGEADIIESFGIVLKDKVRMLIAEKGIRPDGRGIDEIRPLSSEVAVLPRTHGSGLFTRGQTQVLTVATLGAAGDVQIIDDLGLEESKRYMHHYNFPPFSVGETRPLRGPKRREIGHGALAERALLAVLPKKEEFPYTMRLVSEVMSSNGSTSMASVCGSTLALMDAGVPIRQPVAGIAMGLVKQDDKVLVLTDIQGMEDALGDMDFKVAGTRDGVTALQMDIKIMGITREIMREALEKAQKARLTILDNMAQAIAQPREELSPFAPRIISMKIDVDKIRYVVGPGGKMINKIIFETDTTIDIEPDGMVSIAAKDEEGARKAQEMIYNLTRDVEVGETYMGKVTRTEKYGAFVEVLPGKEGLCHISQLAQGRVNRVEDVCEVGDDLLVKVTEIDKLGRINLSHKDAVGGDDGNQDSRRGRYGKRR